MFSKFKLLFVLGALLLFAFGQTAYAVGPTPFTAGPVNPKNGFPLWVQDSNGLTLELCLDDANCFFDAVDTGSAFSVRTGFGGEGFLWAAETSLDGKDFSALIVMAVELAYNPEVIAPGNWFPFTRLRFRIDSEFPGTYTVTHPYGVEEFEVTCSEDAKGKTACDRVFESFDIPFEANAQNQGRIGPFLRWDADAPAGYIGNGGNGIPARHTVTGSPFGTNVFRVEGPSGSGIGGKKIDFVETNEFMVMGKIATRAGVNVTRATYTRGDWDPGIEVFAATQNSDPLEDIEVSRNGGVLIDTITSPPPVTIVDGVPVAATAGVWAGSTDPTGVWRNYFGFVEGDFDPAIASSIVVRNASDPVEDLACLNPDPDHPEFGPSCESAVVVPLVDTVTITEAYLSRVINELEIVAKTSDEVSECPEGPTQPRLKAYGDDGTWLGDLELSTDPAEPGYILEIYPGTDPGLFVSPATVTVKSCFGGSSTAEVGIGFCERAGNSQQCVGG